MGHRSSLTMQPEQYTADAICNAMCVGPLVDPSWRPGVMAIRLLLKPSFHPEACITVTQLGGAASLSVAVLAEMLWRQTNPCHLPAYHDEHELTTQHFIHLAHYHNEVVTNPDSQCTVCVDGLAIDCVWTTGTGHNQMSSHVVGNVNVLRTFVAEMIDLAWRKCTNAGVRNGLAECARYVGAEYPSDPVLPKPKVFRIGVFGSPEDVDEYFRILKGTQREA